MSTEDTRTETATCVDADATFSGERGKTFDAPPIGTAIGRFTVTQAIGRGGMGIVLEAHDPDLDRRVAIKLLRSTQSGGHASRLHREAQAMAKLAHPNVVAVFDVGRWGEQAFIAMELVEGANLREWQKHSHRWQDIVLMYIAAGRGLSAAHDAGLVHRDFKPDNVLVGRDGRPRVGDFGLVAGDHAILDSTITGPLTQSITVDGVCLGTPAYMSPEHWSGERIDARSDQFSFCVALWEALFGPRPFDAPTVVEVRKRVNEGKVAPLDERRVPAWVVATLRRGLARSPAERWPSVPALIAELEHGLARPGRTRTLAAVSALLLITAAGVAYLQREHPARLAATTPTCGVGPEAAAWDTVARSRLAATKPSDYSAMQVRWLDDYQDTIAGTRRARCVAGAISGREEDSVELCLDAAAADLQIAGHRELGARLRFWPPLRPLRSCLPNAREPTVTELLPQVGVDRFTLSPDARRITVWHGGTAVTVRDLASGAEIPLPDAQPLSWVGTDSVALSDSHRLLICSAATGAIEHEFALAGVVAVSPNAGRAAILDGTHLYLVELANPSVREQLTDGWWNEILAMSFSPDSQLAAWIGTADDRELVIHDFVRGTTRRMPLGVYPFGGFGLAWTGSRTFVIGGASSQASVGHLWSVHLAEDLSFLGAPEPVLLAGSNSSFVTWGAVNGTALVGRFTMGRGVEERSSNALRAAPAGLGQLRLDWADITSRRVLGHDASERVFVDLDTWKVVPVDLELDLEASDSLQEVDGVLVGVVVDARHPQAFEQTDGHVVLQEVPPELRSGSAPALRCRGPHCWMYAADERYVYLSRRSGTGYGPVVRLEPPGGVGYHEVRSLDGSLDGLRVVFTENQHRVLISEVGARVVHSLDTGTCKAQSVRFTRNDRAVLVSCVDETFRVLRIDLATGDASEVYASGTTWVSSLETFPEDSYVISTQSYSASIELVTVPSGE